MLKELEKEKSVYDYWITNGTEQKPIKQNNKGWYYRKLQTANSNFTFRLYLDTRYINNHPEHLGLFEVKIRIASKHTKKIKLFKTEVFIKESVFNALYPAYAPKRIRAKKSFQESMGVIANKEENQILKDKIDKQLLEWKNADTSEIRTIEQLENNYFLDDLYTKIDSEKLYNKINNKKDDTI
jgi:hypothetical protein